MFRNLQSNFMPTRPSGETSGEESALRGVGAQPSQRKSPVSPSGSSVGDLAIETLEEQAERLGLLDPLDAEPANIFSPNEAVE